MEDKRACLNCGNQIDKDSVYCSFCGQRNDRNNLKLKALFKDFSENYLSLDTRLGRSIVPFLIQPGRLTQEFIKGKRYSYVNPFRFYLVISVLFFTIVTLVAVSKTNDKGGVIKINENEIAEVDSRSETVTESTDSLRVGEENTSGFEVHASPTNFSLDLSNLKGIEKYRYDREYTDQQLLDTLLPDSEKSYENFVMLQAIRVYRADTNSTVKFIISNYSIAMFLLIPLCALIFMIFFYRNKLAYVGHLIHSIHLHTFTFFIYGVGFTIIHFSGSTPSVFKTTLLISFIISIAYSYLSLQRVYKRSYFGTFLRTIGIGAIYYITWLFIFLIGLIISFLLY